MSDVRTNNAKNGLRTVLWVAMVLLLSLGSGNTHRLENHDNLARGKSYQLYPPPNYKLCTDSDDLAS